MKFIQSFRTFTGSGCCRDIFHGVGTAQLITEKYQQKRSQRRQKCVKQTDCIRNFQNLFNLF